MRNRSFSIIAAILVVAWAASAVHAVIVQNGDFETDAVADGDFSGTATGWTISGAGLWDPDTTRMSSQAGDTNNSVVIFGNPGSVQQALAITVANNKIYTLTVDAGTDSFFNPNLNPPNGGYQFPFPTLG